MPTLWLSPQPFGPSMTSYAITHLRQLEAESIHIIREVAAEFENPVMLYSIGKDSAVECCDDQNCRSCR